MGFLSDLFTGAANGGLSAAARGVQPNAGVRYIEQVCAQLGWGIAERLGNTSLVLHFKDPLFGVRPILVSTGDGGDLVGLSAFSGAEFPANNVPPALAYYLLVRNKEAFFHSWRVTEKDDGTIGFAVWYSTVCSALQPAVFKTICEAMCKEAYEFDAKLRQAGMI